MVGALGVLADEIVELVVALHLAAGRNLAAAIGIEGGLPENLARQPDAVAEVAPVVRMRHVVEADFRLRPRVGRAQRDRAARLRAHRPDMRLEAVRLGRGLAVVAHGGRDEMILDVGVVDAGRRAHEGCRLEMVGGAEAGLEEQPFGADQRLGERVEDRIERDRLERFLLDVEFHMVLQIAPDAGAVGDDLDAVALQLLGRSDARQHEELGRVDGRGRDDDFASCLNDLNLFASFDFDAGRALILDDHAPREATDETDVFAPQRRPEIGIGGGPAAAEMDGLLHRAKAFLLGAVVVVGQLEAGLAAGLDEGGVERVAARAALDVERSVGAAPAVLAALGVLHALEIGEHVGEGPAGRALLGPVVEVVRMAAHIDHAVDGGGAAEHLAARRGQHAAAEMRLGLAGETPVVAAHVERDRQRRRHLDQRTEIAAAIFDDDDRMLAVLRQAIGERRAGRAGADDDEIRLKHFRHVS